ncbi:MAG: Rieske 2Fe-2S domain-containing protein [Gammaproteobacteria bacterium]|nr:Rieske 2Fe-2S domain-containing protein [Gammaproteobacteria bacterium]
MFYPLISVDELIDGEIKTFDVEGFNFLLIKFENDIHLIENKCGHFGVALADGSLRIDKAIASIVCPEHGISFSLATGEVVNRPYENCTPINIYQYEVRDNMIGFVKD